MDLRGCRIVPHRGLSVEMGSRVVSLDKKMADYRLVKRNRPVYNRVVDSSKGVTMIYLLSFSMLALGIGCLLYVQYERRHSHKKP